MIAFRRTCGGLALAFTAGATGLPVRVAIAQARPQLLPPAAYKRLDSLENAALTAATFGDRLNAVTTITRIGFSDGVCVSGPTATVIKYPGLVSRLSATYHRSQDANLRDAILGKMLWVAECDDAVAFLAAAAVDPPPPPPPPPPPGVAFVSDDLRPSLQASAVDILLEFGPRGEAALRRLYGQGMVRDSSARVRLDRLAHQGFRRPPR